MKNSSILFAIGFISFEHLTNSAFAWTSEPTLTPTLVSPTPAASPTITPLPTPTANPYATRLSSPSLTQAQVGASWIEATSGAQWEGRDYHTSVVYSDKIWAIGDAGKNDVWYSKPLQSTTPTPHPTTGITPPITRTPTPTPTSTPEGCKTPNPTPTPEGYKTPSPTPFQIDFYYRDPVHYGYLILCTPDSYYSIGWATDTWQEISGMPDNTFYNAQWSYGTHPDQTWWSNWFYHTSATQYLEACWPSASSSPTIPTPTPSATPSPGYLPTPVYIVLSRGDYTGDGTSDIALFRPSIGLWAVRDFTRTYYGISGDLPVSGDYDGDGSADIGVFRRDSGLWAVQDISRAYFGSSLDRPVPADYDGDGTCDAGVFRDNSGMWAIPGITRICFGTQWDLPAPGDFNGDGTGDIAVVRGDYRPGFWAIRGISRFSFWQGGYGYIPQPGDYDGDGRDEAAVYGQIEGLWMVRDITYSFWGRCCDSSPSGADYNGDGLRDIGIFNEAGRWAVSGITRCWFGSTGDIPVTR